MYARVKDGWHLVHGYEVIVENGYVVRGIFNGRCVYPYIKDKNGEYDLCQTLSLASVRRRLNNDTMRFF